MRFGPDVEWIEREAYEVDPLRARRELLCRRSGATGPAFPTARSLPDYAGIRPKLTGPGEKAADFVIEGRPSTGCAGLVQLFGIESPGLTSCLSLAETVKDACAPQSVQGSKVTLAR